MEKKRVSKIIQYANQKGLKYEKEGILEGYDFDIFKTYRIKKMKNIISLSSDSLLYEISYTVSTGQTTISYNYNVVEKQINNKKIPDFELSAKHGFFSKSKIEIENNQEFNKNFILNGNKEELLTYFDSEKTSYLLNNFNKNFKLIKHNNKFILMNPKRVNAEQYDEFLNNFNTICNIFL